MSNPTVTSPEAGGASQGQVQGQGQTQCQGRARAQGSGPTMAEEEMERIEEKRASGNVLDPIALNDPAGQSVERVILRVGVAVVGVIVVGILLAQIACKNIMMSGVTDFSETTVTGQTVEKAVTDGFVWGDEVIKFTGVDDASYDSAAGTVTVKTTDSSSRTFDQLASDVQSRAMPLSMTLFEDSAISSVSIEVSAHVDEETGQFTGRSSDPVRTVLTVTWSRSADDTSTYYCTMQGYDASARRSTADLVSEEAAR